MSEGDLIADEAAVDRELVVEGAGHDVAVLGDPIDAAAAPLPCRSENGVDQRSSYTSASGFRGCERSWR